MKIRYINTLIITLVLVFSFSCSEDFLKVEPTGRLSSETYLQTDEEVKIALIGVYNFMQHNFSSGSWSSVYFIKNLPGDDCLAGSSAGDQAEYQQIDDFEHQTDNSKIANIWSYFYKTISAANTVINDVQAESDEIDKMIAEAKALRAITYLDLVIMFGDVPLMTVNPTSEEEYHKPRSPKADVYALIESDLKAAIELLPLKSQFSDSDKFRIAKGTAQAFLGKAYLYQKKYAEAAAQFDAVIASGEYDLEPNFADVWSAGAEFGVESLFEISYTSQEIYDWGTFPWGGGNESNIEAQLQGPRDAIFDFSNSSLDIVNGWGFNMPSEKIGKAFENENDTERGDATVMSAAKFEATGGAIKADGTTHDYEGYMRVKYATRASESSSEGIRELNYTINWRVLRYADVLLMAAEAYHFNSMDSKAVTEINKVRTRAKLSEISVADDVFATIVKERQLELAFEGSRYWDLVRWDMAAAELGDLGFVANKHELFPIPQNEIIGNKMIEPEDQNQGW